MLIYDGILSPDIHRYCEDATREYGYAVEVRDFPAADWYQTLKQRTWWQQHECMGYEQSVERKGTRYRIVKKHFASGTSSDPSGFLFLVDRDDYDKAIAELSDLIINPKPFTTLLGKGIA